MVVPALALPHPYLPQTLKRPFMQNNPVEPMDDPAVQHAVSSGHKLFKVFMSFFGLIFGISDSSFSPFCGLSLPAKTTDSATLRSSSNCSHPVSHSPSLASLRSGLPCSGNSFQPSRLAIRYSSNCEHSTPGTCRRSTNTVPQPPAHPAVQNLSWKKTTTPPPVPSAALVCPAGEVCFTYCVDFPLLSTTSSDA